MYVQEVTQDEDGVLVAVQREEEDDEAVAAPVDWSSWGGLLTPCAGACRTSGDIPF